MQTFTKDEVMKQSDILGVKYVLWDEVRSELRDLDRKLRIERGEVDRLEGVIQSLDSDLGDALKALGQLADALGASWFLSPRAAQALEVLSKHGIKFL